MQYKLPRWEMYRGRGLARYPLAWTVTSLSSSHLIPGGASASLQDGLLLCIFLSFSLAACPLLPVL